MERSRGRHRYPASTATSPTPLLSPTMSQSAGIDRSHLVAPTPHRYPPQHDSSYSRLPDPVTQPRTPMSGASSFISHGEHYDPSNAKEVHLRMAKDDVPDNKVGCCFRSNFHEAAASSSASGLGRSILRISSRCLYRDALGAVYHPNSGAPLDSWHSSIDNVP